jgi:hypothetical protein
MEVNINDTTLLLQTNQGTSLILVVGSIPPPLEPNLWESDGDETIRPKPLEGGEPVKVSIDYILNGMDDRVYDPTNRAEPVAFESDLDDLRAITTPYPAVSFEVIQGGTVTGTIEAVQNANDGNTLRVNESAGGLTVDFTFSGVQAFNVISLHMRYAGGANHMWEIQLWNFLTNGWDVKGETEGNQDYLTWFNIVVPEDNQYLNNGAVKVRFYHLPNFITAHFVLFDYVAVVATLTAASLLHNQLEGRDAANAHPATAVSVDASNFVKNLDTTDDTVQKFAQKFDGMDLGGAVVVDGTTIIGDGTNEAPLQAVGAAATLNFASFFNLYKDRLFRVTEVDMSKAESAVTGTGANTFFPTFTTITSGSTANSSARLSLLNIGYLPSQQWRNVAFNKEFFIAFKIWMTTVQSETGETVISLGKASTTYNGDLQTFGVGIKYSGALGNPINLHYHNGTTLFNVSSGINTVARESYDIVIYNKGDGTLQLYINGALRASVTGSTVATGTLLRLQADVTNGNTAAATILLMSNIEIYARP